MRNRIRPDQPDSQQQPNSPDAGAGAGVNGWRFIEQ